VAATEVIALRRRRGGRCRGWCHRGEEIALRRRCCRCQGGKVSRRCRSSLRRRCWCQRGAEILLPLRPWGVVTHRWLLLVPLHLALGHARFAARPCALRLLARREVPRSLGGSASGTLVLSITHARLALVLSITRARLAAASAILACPVVVVVARHDDRVSVLVCRGHSLKGGGGLRARANLK